jgi:cystathionine beta-lyase family protein involved in aluminum resistance
LTTVYSSRISASFKRKMLPSSPLREPYIAFCQGGTNWTHVALAIKAAIQAVGHN